MPRKTEMPEDVRRMTAEMRKMYDNFGQHPRLEAWKGAVDTSRGARIGAKKQPRQTLATSFGADADPTETAKEGYRAIATGEIEDPILSRGTARALGAGLAAYQGLETAGGVSGAGATQYAKGRNGIVRPRLSGYDDMVSVARGTSGVHLLDKSRAQDTGVRQNKKKPSDKTLRNAMLGLDALEITSRNGETGSTITNPEDGQFTAATRYKALVSFLSNPKSVVNDAIIKRVMNLPGSHNIKAALVGRPDFPIDRYLARIMNSGDFLVQKAVALRKDLPKSVLSKVKESDATDLSGFAAGIAERPDLSEDGMRLLMTHRSPAVRGAVAGRNDLPGDLVEAAFRDEAPGVRYRAIMSGRVPDAILKEAFGDRDPLITATMARRPDAPPELFRRLLSTPPGDKYHEANVISALRNPRARPADIMEWLRTSLDSPVWKLGIKDAYKNRILIDTLSKRGDLNMARVLSTMLLGVSQERADSGATNPFYLENSNARDAARNYLEVNARRVEKDRDRPEARLSNAMRRRIALFSSLANPANWFGKDGVPLDKVGLSKYASFLSDLSQAGVVPALTDTIPGSEALNGTSFRDIQYFPDIVTKSPFLQRGDAIRMTEDVLRETRGLMNYFGIPEYSAPNKLAMIRDLNANALVRPEFVPDSPDRPFLMWAHPAIGKTRFANGTTYIDFDQIKGDRLPQMLGPDYRSGFEGRQAFRKKYPGVLEDATSRLLDEVIADPAYKGAVVMMSDKSILRDRYGDLDVIINTPRDVFLRHETGRGAEASRDPEMWKSDLDPLIDAARGSGKVIDTRDYLSDFFARPNAMDMLAAAGAAGHIEDRGSFGHAVAPSGAPLPPDYLYGFRSSFAGGDKPVRWFLDPARVYEDPRVSAFREDAYTSDANEFVKGGHRGLGTASLEYVDAGMRKKDSKGRAAQMAYNSIGGADWETRHKLATALNRLFDMRRLVSEIDEGNRNLAAVPQSPYYRSVYRLENQRSNVSAGEIKLRVPNEDLVNWSKAVLVPDGMLSPGSAKGDYFRRTYPHVRIETYSDNNDFLDKSGSLGYEYSQAAKGGDTRADAKGGNASAIPRGHNAALDGYSGPRIVINPSTFRNEKDGLCVAFDEAFRIIQEINGFDPVAEPTEKQRAFFADTAYNDDERMLRRTILARICTFDTSVTDPTDEQLQEAVEFLDTVMEIGAPQNEWEQRAVQRIRDTVARSVGQPRAEEPATPEPPVDEGTVEAGVGGMETDEDKRVEEENSGAEFRENAQAQMDESAKLAAQGPDAEERKMQAMAEAAGKAAGGDPFGKSEEMNAAAQEAGLKADIAEAQKPENLMQRNGHYVDAQGRVISERAAKALAEQNVRNGAAGQQGDGQPQQNLPQNASERIGTTSGVIGLGGRELTAGEAAWQERRRASTEAWMQRTGRGGDSAVDALAQWNGVGGGQPQIAGNGAAGQQGDGQPQQNRPQNASERIGTTSGVTGLGGRELTAGEAAWQERRRASTEAWMQRTGRGIA